MALISAAEKGGLKLYHGSAGRMLQNKKYLGDDYYQPSLTKKLLIKQKKSAWVGQKHWGGCGNWKERRTSFSLPTLPSLQ